MKWLDICDIAVLILAAISNFNLWRRERRWRQKRRKL